MVYDDHESEEEEEDESVVSEEEEEEGAPEEKRRSDDEAVMDGEEEDDDDDSDYPEEMEDEDDASYCTESSFRSHSTYSSTPGRGGRGELVRVARGGREGGRQGGRGAQSFAPAGQTCTAHGGVVVVDGGRCSLRGGGEAIEFGDAVKVAAMRGACQPTRRVGDNRKGTPAEIGHGPRGGYVGYTAAQKHPAVLEGEGSLQLGRMLASQFGLVGI